MDPSTNWRSSLTASERYENIQKIQHSLAASGGQSAFSIENSACDASASREEYENIIASWVAKGLQDHETITNDDLPVQSGSSSPGVRIGPYENCHYVASGATAEVYRSGVRALKVIVETHNIEPHSPSREIKILETLQRPCIELLETFRDQEQRLVLVFPYMPVTLASLLEKGPLTNTQITIIFGGLFQALAHLHQQGIIHRDVKPSALLLESANGPVYLSDFGTAWHPSFSAMSEPADGKVLDIGTGPYRAPDVLFGDKAYGPPVDMWAAGAMLAECCRNPPVPLFESRAVHEDGNQLGLILSIFKTMGSPTPETWPEALRFKTPPFTMYRSFPSRPWEAILPEVETRWRNLVGQLVRYGSTRATAESMVEALKDMENAQ